MKRRFFSLFAILLIFSSLHSCDNYDSSHYVSCSQLVSQLTEKEIGLPCGRIYSYEKSEGSPGFVSSSLLSAMYGEGSVPDCCLYWIDYAVFLSQTAHPCEICIVLCSSPQNAEDTAKLMCKRFDSLRAKYSEEYPSYFTRDSVYIYNNYVIFTVSSDPENAYHTAVKLIK